MRCVPRKPLPPVMVIRLFFIFFDRIYRIDWIFLLFSPFPEEREKDKQPEADESAFSGGNQFCCAG